MSREERPLPQHFLNSFGKKCVLYTYKEAGGIYAGRRCDDGGEFTLSATSFENLVLYGNYTLLEKQPPEIGEVYRFSNMLLEVVGFCNDGRIKYQGQNTPVSIYGGTIFTNLWVLVTPAKFVKGEGSPIEGMVDRAIKETIEEPRETIEI